MDVEAFEDRPQKYKKIKPNKISQSATKNVEQLPKEDSKRTKAG